MSAFPGPILVLDSDRDSGELLAQRLAADGYRVEVARSTEHARLLAGESPPRLALLGKLDRPRAALELLEEIRAGAWQDPNLPTLVLGTRADQLDVLRAFEAGADDFLLRSGGYLELRARVGALLRRCDAARETTARVQVGALTIDTASRRATLAGAHVGLRRLEFDLLLHLAREPTRVFHRVELLRSVWGYRCKGSTRTVDSHASRLRGKLDREREGRWVVGVRGVGYRLT